MDVRSYRDYTIQHFTEELKVASKGTPHEAFSESAEGQELIKQRVASVFDEVITRQTIYGALKLVEGEKVTRGPHTDFAVYMQMRQALGLSGTSPAVAAKAAPATKPAAPAAAPVAAAPSKPIKAKKTEPIPLGKLQEKLKKSYEGLSEIDIPESMRRDCPKPKKTDIKGVKTLDLIIAVCFREGEGTFDEKGGRGVLSADQVNDQQDIGLVRGALGREVQSCNDMKDGGEAYLRGKWVEAHDGKDGPPTFDELAAGLAARKPADQRGKIPTKTSNTAPPPPPPKPFDLLSEMDQLDLKEQLLQQTRKPVAPLRQQPPGGTKKSAAAPKAAAPTSAATPTSVAGLKAAVSTPPAAPKPANPLTKQEGTGGGFGEWFAGLFTGIGNFFRALWPF